MAKKEEKKSNLVPLLLLLLAGFFIYLFMKPEPKPVTQTPVIVPGSPQAKRYEDKVNKYLFETSQKMELDRQKAALEAAKIANQDLHLGPPAPPTNNRPEDVDISSDPHAEALLKALGREAKSPGDPSNPQEQIQAELFAEQRQEEYSEQYKQEYARQFVENARKAGYEVKLNSDFKVISVKPLNRPADNYQLFQNLGNGAQ